MFHSRDSRRLLVCDTGLYLEQNDIGFITVAICGGYISKYPGLRRVTQGSDMAVGMINRFITKIWTCGLMPIGFLS